MSQSLSFLNQAGPGTVVLVTTTSWIHGLVRAGQSTITQDGKPSRWGHVFLIGHPRKDEETRIYESDIYFTRSGLKNGAQENTLSKYGDDRKNVAFCVMDFRLTPEETDKIITRAQQKIEEGIQYPVLELFGSLWAYLTKTFREPNPLDLKRASYCSAFVNNCFDGVELIIPKASVHPSNVSPEHIFQSQMRNPTRKELEL